MSDLIWGAHIAPIQGPVQVPHAGWPPLLLQRLRVILCIHHRIVDPIPSQYKERKMHTATKNRIEEQRRLHAARVPVLRCSQVVGAWPLLLPAPL